MLIRNSALVLASVLAGLLIGETMARFVEPQQTMAFFRLTGSGYYQFDDRLGWRPVPNTSGLHPLGGNTTSYFSTNSLGLRDTEVRLESPENVFRIVALGDSFTWGWGVNDGEIFTDQLEEMVTGLEVVNLGVTGYGLQQYRLYLEQTGFGLDPDLVLIAVCQNDVRETSRDFLSIARKQANRITQKSTTTTKKPRKTLKVTLSEHFASYRLLVQAINSNRAIAEFFVSIGLKERLGGFEELDYSLRPALREYPEAVSEQWRRVESELAEIARLTRERDVPLVVAAIPAVQTVDAQALESTLAYTAYTPENFDLDKPYRRLRSISESHNILFINPVEEFRRMGQLGHRLFLYQDMHFNAQGHELFARAIADSLDRAGLLAPVP